MQVKKSLKIFFILVSIAVYIAVIAYLDFDFSAIDKTFASLTWSTALLATLCFVVHTYLVYCAWRVIVIRKLDLPPQPAIALVYFASLIARYLPGGIWHLGGRAYWLAKNKVRPLKITQSLLADQLLSLIALAIVALVGALLIYQEVFSIYHYYQDKLEGLGIYLLIGMVVCVVLAFYLLKRFGKSLQLATWLSYFDIQLIGFHVLAIVFFVLGHALIFSSTLSIDTYLLLCFVLGIATIMGVFVIFSPGGLGVRELGFSLLLVPLAQDKNLLALVIFPRIFVFLAECLLFVVFTVRYSRD